MDIPTHAQLVERIDRFLERSGIKPTRLGREVTGEPNLIPSIRAGRSPNLDTLNKLARFIDDHDEAAAADPLRPPFSSAFGEAAPIAPQPSSSRLLDSLADAARRTA